MSVLCVGTLAFDTVETPTDKRERVLGGSASYFSYAASFFTPVRVVGRVGHDWPDDFTRRLTQRGIDFQGVAKDLSHKSYFWHGRYRNDFQDRETVAIELNGFEDYKPTVPAAFSDSEIVFLAASAPHVQLQTISQCPNRKLVFADTVDMWIETTRPELLKVLSQIDGLLINDIEARQLTGEHQTVRAAKAIRRFGPDWVVLKKGENGCLAVGPDNVMISLPGYPTDSLRDPTGAGDSFAGGMIGFLCQSFCTRDSAWTPSDFHPALLHPALLHRALLHGTAVASFTLSDFSLNALETLEKADIERRVTEILAMLSGT
jgi:sugar/nucleoside kinase (ribokinase family)